MRKTISEELRKKIHEKITSIEAHSFLEIVPVHSQRSSHYLFFRSLVSSALLFISFAYLEYFHPGRFAWNLGVSVLVAAGTCLLMWPALILRHLLPRYLKLHSVEEAAHSVFLREEIFATEKRTGILIYISELEKAVYILADKGLVSKVPADTWMKLGDQLAKDFGRQSAGETFMEGLEEISSKIAAQFKTESPTHPHLTDDIREI